MGLLHGGASSSMDAHLAVFPAPPAEGNGVLSAICPPHLNEREALPGRRWALKKTHLAIPIRHLSHY